MIHAFIFIFVSVFAQAESAEECTSACIARRPTRKGSACMEEMCRRNCDLLSKKKNGEGSLKLSSDKQTLYVNGKIDSNFLDELTHMLRDDPEMLSDELRKRNRETSEKIRFLVLNSPGGDSVYGERLAKWVEQKGANLKVIVPEGGICGSACANIFRCAQNRVANKSALIMFHPTYMEGELGEHEQNRIRADNARSENSPCALNAAKTQVGKTIRRRVMRGEESCYTAAELSGSNNDFLEVEGDGTGNSQASLPAGSSEPASGQR